MKSFMKVWLGIALMAIGFGIVLVIIAFATSGFHKVEPTSSLHQSLDGVKSIDMDIDYRAVKVVTGDKFEITADNVAKSEIESYIKDDTWYIKENKKEQVNIFGWKFPVNRIFDWDNSNTIEITIPKGFVADNIQVSIKAGELDAEELIAGTSDIDVQSGRLYVKNLIVKDSSRYHVGAGEIRIDQIKAKNIDMSCEVGNVNVSGDITGDNVIKNKVGNVDFKLDGKESDYSYDVSCEVGNVTVGDSNYHNINNKIINQKDAKNNIKLGCGVGKINVKFNQ